MIGKIYKIWNDVNDKIYIGSTKMKLEERFKSHKNISNKYLYEKSCPFIKALKDIGFNNFHIELIEYFEYTTNIDLLTRENYYMNLYQSRNPDYGYNLNRSIKPNKEELACNRSKYTKMYRDRHLDRYKKHIQKTNLQKKFKNLASNELIKCMLIEFDHFSCP